eukprot:scaffold46967_cov72-Phaeocystis_antarctica.AAC.1
MVRVVAERVVARERPRPVVAQRAAAHGAAASHGPHRATVSRAQDRAAGLAKAPPPGHPAPTLSRSLAALAARCVSPRPAAAPSAAAECAPPPLLSPGWHWLPPAWPACPRLGAWSVWTSRALR